MNSDIENQLIRDLNQCSSFSIRFDESTGITPSTRLSIISRFCINDEVRVDKINIYTSQNYGLKCISSCKCP